MIVKTKDVQQQKEEQQQEPNYFVIRKGRVSEVEKAVSEAMAKGYEPCGGISSNGYDFLQAMIKRS